MSYYKKVPLLWTPAADGYRFLLDEFGSGAKGAWALNKLRSGYSGNCIRVRRSSDNSELDIGFIGNWLDETTLLTFCGSGDGFIVYRYDHTTNASHMFQLTNGNQVKIVNAGSVYQVNGRPAFLYNSGSYNGFIAALTGTAGATGQFFGVHKLTGNQSIPLAAESNSGVFGFYALNGDGAIPHNAMGTPVYSVNGSTISSTRDAIYDAIINVQALLTARSLYVNDITSFADSYTQGGGNHYKGYKQLDVIYNTTAEAQADIENLINENYLIF
jgi:hypothetical protein